MTDHEVIQQAKKRFPQRGGVEERDGEVAMSKDKRKRIVEVRFKHEDCVDGVPVGPLYDIDEDGQRTDAARRWVTIAEAEAHARAVDAPLKEV